MEHGASIGRLAHEDGHEGHAFHKSGKQNGDGENLTEGGGVATGGFSGFHADETNAETGAYNGKTYLGQSGCCKGCHGGLFSMCLVYVWETRCVTFSS